MDAREQATSLKAARLAAGITHEDLAARLRVTRQAISAWENDNGNPGGPARILLAQELNVDIETVDSWFAREPMAVAS